MPAVCTRGAGSSLQADFASKAWEQLEKAQQGPWSRDQFPELAQWLDASETPLKRLVVCTRCPHFYSPLVGQGHSSVVASLEPGLDEYKLTGKILTARAMLRVREGKTDSAFEDLLTCHRLGRLIGQGPLLLDGLVGCKLDRTASIGDAALAFHGHPPADRVARYLADLQQLPPLPDLAAQVDVNERFSYLDSVAAVARIGPGALFGSTDPGSLDSRLNRQIRDWNEVLRMGNDFYDRMVATARKPTRSERLQALKALDAEEEAMDKQGSTNESIIKSIAVRRSRTDMASTMGARLLALLTPAMRVIVDAGDRSRAQTRLAEVSLALAAYRADHGRYPPQLSVLCPKYLPELPKDPFSDGDFRYFLRAENCILYSVGPNGVDDGGRTEARSPTCDDILACPGVEP